MAGKQVFFVTSVERQLLSWLSEYTVDVDHHLRIAINSQKAEQLVKGVSYMIKNIGDDKASALISDTLERLVSVGVLSVVSGSSETTPFGIYRVFCALDSLHVELIASREERRISADLMRTALEIQRKAQRFLLPVAEFTEWILSTTEHSIAELLENEILVQRKNGQTYYLVAAQGFEKYTFVEIRPAVVPVPVKKQSNDSFADEIQSLLSQRKSLSGRLRDLRTAIQGELGNITGQQEESVVRVLRLKKQLAAVQQELLAVLNAIADFCEKNSDVWQVATEPEVESPQITTTTTNEIVVPVSKIDAVNWTGLHRIFKAIDSFPGQRFIRRDIKDCYDQLFDKDVCALFSSDWNQFLNNWAMMEQLSISAYGGTVRTGERGRPPVYCYELTLCGHENRRHFLESMNG